MNSRILGTIAIIASPMLLLSGIHARFDLTNPGRLDSALGLIFVLGWASGAIGLRQARATGNGAAGGWLLGIQLGGLVLAMIEQVFDLVFAHPNTDNVLYQVASTGWPLSVMYMIGLGCVVLAVRRLKGWRRWTPLLCGLALPILLGTTAVAGKKIATGVFCCYTAGAWALLGLAVRSAAPTIESG